MALTRSMLKGMGLSDEQIGAIIDAHTETVDGLKESLKAAKADAERLSAVQKELDALKANDGGDYKSKFEKAQSEFEAYKKAVETEKADAEKRTLYRELLKSCGIDAKRLDAVMKVVDLGAVTVKDGAIENADALSDGIRTEWADFIPQETTRGASVQNPPNGGGTAKRSKDEILAIKDTAERQRAIAENPEAFGLKF